LGVALEKGGFFADRDFRFLPLFRFQRALLGRNEALAGQDREGGNGATSGAARLGDDGFGDDDLN
jgi:hypothetical protein